MIQYLYRFSIIFSLFIGLSGCSTAENGFSNTINDIQFSNQTRRMVITINSNQVGTNNMTILTGIYKSFNGTPHNQCINISENITINGETQTTTTFTKKIVSGYMYLSDEISTLSTAYIQLPIAYNSRFFGPFSAISSENVTLTTVGFHETYTNQLGQTFENVMEAHDESGLIRLFINQANYIIQKEDYRYQPTIQSLDNN
ncbi:MAG: hypothetical protein VW397_05040 [Candidatus Margulisiibacteriota bacterium]